MCVRRFSPSAWVLTLTVPFFIFSYAARADAVGRSQDERMSRAVDAIAASSGEECSKILAEFDREPNAECYAALDTHEDLLVDASGNKAGSVRSLALYLLPYVGGYRANSALMEALKSGNELEVTEVAYHGLRWARGDPRIGPALLATFKQFREAGDSENVVPLAVTIGNNGYSPAIPAILSEVTALSDKNWWLDPGRLQKLTSLLTSLDRLGESKDVTSTYNRLLNEAAGQLQEERPSSDLLNAQADFLHLPYCAADSETLNTLVRIARSASGETSVSDQPVITPPSLRQAAVAGLRAALPYTDDWNLSDYEAVARNWKPSAYFTHQLEQWDLVDGVPTNLLYVVSARKLTGSKSALESWLTEPGLPQLLAQSVANNAVRMGSWKGFEFLLRDAMKGDEGAGLLLRRAAGVNLGHDWSQWQSWMDKARASLSWDPATNSWQPRDRWEALAREYESKTAPK